MVIFRYFSGTPFLVFFGPWSPPVILFPIGRQPLKEMPIGYNDFDPESEKGFRVYYILLAYAAAHGVLGYFLRQRAVF